MANKVAGVDVMLYMQTGTDGSQNPIFTVLGGQSGATLNRSTNVIETTSKDDNGWQSNITGVKSWSIECEGFIVADDSAYQAMEQAWLNGDELDVKLAYPSGKTYTGKVVISDFPEEYPGDDAATYKLTLTGTGALTIGTGS